MEREQQLRLMALFRADMEVIEPEREWADGVPHPSFKRDAAAFRFEISTYLFRVWCAGRNRAVPVGQLPLLNLDMPASAGDDAHYPPCDYCAEPLSYHPWHGSGLINGVESRHIHACDKCRHLLPTVSAGEPVPATISGTEYRYREALKQLREVLDPEDWMGEISMHAFIDAALSAPSHGEQMRDNRAEFKREERYMVVKLSKLADDLGGDELSREEQIYRLAHFGKALVECVVVESDWPEYEPTWAAIKARVTGSIASNQLPGGWAAKPTDDGEGFIISSPRVNGVASHFSVFPDSKDYASCALWKMLAATPSACSCGEPDVAGTHRKDGPCHWGPSAPSVGSQEQDHGL